MSESAHPNINAAGWTAEIIESFSSHLRGVAAKEKDLAFAVLHDSVVDFVTKISAELDVTFKS